MDMRALLTAGLALALMNGSAMAQKPKPTRFWNLTLNTVTRFQLSPAGKDAWGPDQCKNDRDGTVDHDERLNVTDVPSGRYDARLADKTGRICIVRAVEVKAGAVFAIEEKQLTDCGK
jgi:hypothetical protein